jgi:hypothetical protein
MDLQEVGGGCGDWMQLAQDRDRWRALVSTVRNLRVPKMRGICGLAAEPVSFSRRALVRGVSKYTLDRWFPKCAWGILRDARTLLGNKQVNFSNGHFEIYLLFN